MHITVGAASTAQRWTGFEITLPKACSRWCWLTRQIGWPGSMPTRSNPPYGYRYRPKADNTPQQLVVDEAEAEIVRLMYGWLIEEGCSSYAIEKRLVTQGVPARTRNHTGWRQSSVIGILRNPLYRGEAYVRAYTRINWTYEVWSDSVLS